MKVLAIETATSRHSVAILDDRSILARSDQDAQGAHARLLIPTIDRLLGVCGLSLSALDGLAVSIGPGSFTGLRVGLATAMGIRLATGLSLAAVPTLEAMAWNHRDSPYALCPVLKARTGEVYWAVYQWEAGQLNRVVEARVGSLSTMAQSLQGTIVMLGEGWSLHRDAFRELLDAQRCGIVEAPEDALAASAVSVGLAGLERLARGQIEGSGLAPMYVQRAEADVTWDRQHAVTQAGTPVRRPD